MHQIAYWQLASIGCESHPTIRCIFPRICEIKLCVQTVNRSLDYDLLVPNSFLSATFEIKIRWVYLWWEFVLCVRVLHLMDMDTIFFLFSFFFFSFFNLFLHTKSVRILFFLNWMLCCTFLFCCTANGSGDGYRNNSRIPYPVFFMNWYDSTDAYWVSDQILSASGVCYSKSTI